MNTKWNRKFESVVVDPDIESRMRLKQATASVHHFGRLVQATTLPEALEKIEASEFSFDVVFLSYRFSQEQLAAFVKSAKALKNSEDSAYVLMLRNENQDSTTVAQTMMIGGDGMLFEPYSVDYLVEITQLAAKVKKERSDARERAVIALLINDIIKQVDKVSYIKACNFDFGTSMKQLRDMCGVIAGLDQEKLPFYIKSAVEAFEAAPLPVELLQQKKYTGVSSRIRRKVEQRVLAKLDKPGGPEGTPSKS